MTHHAFPSFVVAVSVLGAPALVAAGEVEFEPPVRLQAGGEFVKVELPGYAAPAFVDLNGDGHGDLVVGQFHQGKLRVYHGSANGFQSGEWLHADGEVAQVPGVW